MFVCLFTNIIFLQKKIWKAMRQTYEWLPPVFGLWEIGTEVYSLYLCFLISKMPIILSPLDNEFNTRKVIIKVLTCSEHKIDFNTNSFTLNTSFQFKNELEKIRSNWAVAMWISRRVDFHLQATDSLKSLTEQWIAGENRLLGSVMPPSG